MEQLEQLENYFDSINNGKVSKDIYEKYNEFGFESELDFKIIVEFLMNKIYNYSREDDISTNNKRLDQKKFAKLIRERDGRCVISGKIKAECVASHIVEVKNGGNYDIDNGFLLESGLHQTFDNHLWCINPITLKIEVKKHHDAEATIRQWEGQQINFTPSKKMIENLKMRYNDYLKH